MVLCPEGTAGFSPGFQPRESSPHGDAPQRGARSSVTTTYKYDVILYVSIARPYFGAHHFLLQKSNAILAATGHVVPLVHFLVFYFDLIIARRTNRSKTLMLCTDRITNDQRTLNERKPRSERRLGPKAPGVTKYDGGKWVYRKRSTRCCRQGSRTLGALWTLDGVEQHVNSRTVRRSFMLGMAKRLQARLFALIEEAKSGLVLSESREIVLLKEEIVEKALGDLNLRFKKTPKSKSTAFDFDAFAAGEVAGDNVSISSGTLKDHP
jgi:hypothetical protein